MKKIYFIIIVLSIGFSCWAQNKAVNLEDIWKNYSFYPEYIWNLESMNNGAYYTQVDRGDNGSKLNKYSYRTGKRFKTIADSEKLGIAIGNYTFSENEQKVLFATDTERIYRYSSRSIFYVYDISSRKLTKLSDDKVMYATFSPDGSQVAFVKDNNLFLKDIASMQETQITTDGVNNQVINGASDWVYEEEFGLVRAFFWSPDGSKIAFYRFNENEVKKFSMDMFRGGLYPSKYEFKYPKAGENNSEISLHVYDVNQQSTKKIDVLLDYEYLPRMGWTKDVNSLYVFRMNRHQNHLDFLLVDANTAKSRVLFTETDKYYLDVHDNTTFLNDGKHFIWTSEKSGYNHLYKVSIEDGSMQQITSGNWEVTSYHGIHNESGKVYYTSTEDGAINRSVFSINIDGTDKQKLTNKIGTNSATFSKGMKYFINNYSTANTPPYFSLHNANGKQIRVLKDNKELSKKMSEYAFGDKEFFSFTTIENISLNGWMIKPADFDSTKQYPVFMFLYGGPGSQQVLNSWGWNNYFWYQHLTQQGYIVACIDNRGTGGRGAEFKKMTYKQLGNYETIDQIEANKYLGSLTYVDANRIGIQGWSYGGYLSSLAITKGADVFKMAIAVAPVTNWRYYDNIYTERYMRTPQENAEGYDDNSPIKHVDKLKGKYLLIHGSADDNVHVQNTYEMVSALVQSNKQFDLFIYPDKNHGIYGGNTRLHLYQMMTDYILENL
ncbi:MAG: S9 family peptidase [Flavobacteriales bacterium]|nr:S9 family peptidase [Flavobacteriales bacterium]|tara:strand:- start:16722 stop:18881 length:2160 start_codon:yes stop_codon:yes gene_type:complete